MRFFGHDPEAERRKGLLLLVVGGLVAVGVLAGLLLSPGAGVPKRVFGAGIAGGIFAACFAVVGVLALKDAAALRRERSLRGAGPPLEARVRFRPRLPAPEPDPERGPGLPARRLIAVSVMFAGLILPALLGAIKLVGRGPEAILLSVLLLGLASCLSCLLAALWRGKASVWMPAVSLFGFGFAISLLPLVGGILTGDRPALLWGGAATAHFLVGLIALLSLYPWIRTLESKPARDPLAGADKAALAAGLRARKR